MKHRVTVANVWWSEAASLRDARDLALAEAGALALSLGWTVEARVTDPAGAFAGIALGRPTGIAEWLPLGAPRARAA